jgi:ferrochelatase
MTGPVGVAVMAYGTPSSPEDVERYYTDIRRGRPPAPEQLAELRGRYEAIGGVSTMAERTRAQCEGLAAALDERAPGGFIVELGQKHAPPTIEQAVERLAARGCREVVGLVLAPHYSRASVGDYHRRATGAATAAGAAYRGIDQWFAEPAYVAFMAAAVRRALAGVGTSERATKVLFSAHSLPERVLVDDPYPLQLHDGAALIAEQARLQPWAGWTLAWQSAGRTDDPWRGPDVSAVIAELAASGRAEGVVVCPHGFVADHLEVAYDLDLVARDAAARCGLAFARTEVVNDDQAVLGALADLVARIAAEHSGG